MQAMRMNIYPTRFRRIDGIGFEFITNKRSENALGILVARYSVFARIADVHPYPVIAPFIIIMDRSDNFQAIMAQICRSKG